MTQIRYSLLQKIILGLAAGAIIMLGAAVGVKGYSGTVYGRAENVGYFTGTYNTCSNCGTKVLPSVNGGDAIPSWVNTVPTFIQFLKDANDSGVAQRKTGSAFIAYTMLGLSGGNHNRDVSDVDWAELESRLNASSIQWNSTVSKVINSYYDTEIMDDVFHDAERSLPGIIVSDRNGNVLYELLRFCANPMGRTAGIPKANEWTISASSTAKVGGVVVSSAKPGDLIQWTHTLTNNGPDATTSNVHSNLLLSGFSTPSDWVNEPAGEWSAGDNGSGTAKGPMRTLVNYATYRVVQADVGNTLCEKVRFDRKSGVDDTGGEGNNPCVTIPYNYTLTPNISTDLTGVIEPNASTSITPSVANAGPTKSRATQWQVTQMIVSPTRSLSNQAGGTSVGEPCGSFYGPAPNVVCTTIKSGNSVFSENGSVISGSTLGAETVTAGDLPVGTQICFAFSVQPYSSGSSQWRHSVPVCLTVGKKPKIQVHGGDLSVGKLFSGATTNTKRVQTSISAKNDAGTRKVFGSWVEYGIFVTRTISGAGSRSAYAGPNGSTDVAACAPHRLSFTNASATDLTCGAVGRYVPARLIPNVLASFPGVGEELAAPNAVVPNSLIPATGGSYIGTHNGDIRLNTSTLAPGKSIILKVSGTVTITANQTYDSDNRGTGYTQPSQLPQLIIIANKIIIESRVTNVDAWLIANGTDGIIETCDTGSTTYVLSTDATKLSSEKCNETLTINGPVMAKQLWLRRTGGSGTGAESGSPAEVFNLRPDAYLWATTKASGDGRVQTVYTTELPPRL